MNMCDIPVLQQEVMGYYSDVYSRMEGTIFFPAYSEMCYVLCTETW
jgi:hypothetical protein